MPHRALQTMQKSKVFWFSWFYSLFSNFPNYIIEHSVFASKRQIATTVTPICRKYFHDFAQSSQKKMPVTAVTGI
jgi:hypothetical protein